MRRAILIAALFAPEAALAAEPNGMPQFAFSNPLTSSQVLWMCVIFAVLYGVLATWALPMLGGVIEDRARRIREDLEAARAAKSEADAAATELRAATQRARAEAQAALASATSAARDAASEQAATLNARLDVELKAAETRISAARNAAMGALGEAARETARAMIERLTGRAPDAARLESAVDHALSAHGG